jgi:GDPmannose 4,6-dehydratase
LGWKPKLKFEDLVRVMVEHDLELAEQERTLSSAGHRVIVRGVAHG